MKNLSEDLKNIAVLSEIEMSKILGGDNDPFTTHTTTEDEDDWM
jgi:hypothetical protein